MLPAPANIYVPNVDGFTTTFSYGVLGRGSIVVAEILDTAGNVVVTLDDAESFVYAGLSLDARSVSWDGSLADGSEAQFGKYRFRVSATDKLGNVVK